MIALDFNDRLPLSSSGMQPRFTVERG